MINYVIGDATEPQVGKGERIIAHICNDLGGWGSGFVCCLSNKWPQPEKNYREWFEWAKHKDEGGNVVMPLGMIQLVQVPDPNKNGPLYIANMVAQHGYTSSDNPVALRYDALASCLRDLGRWMGNYYALKSRIGHGAMGEMPDITIHMPRIGCGLAGGSWNVVEHYIAAILGGTDVYVYDLEEK